jgi:hypothetical protein
VTAGELGRRPPTDWEHVEKYPLQALPMRDRPQFVPSPVGVNWYAEFDRPTLGRDSRWRVAANGKLTRIRGGHCVVFVPPRTRDHYSWWKYYNQGAEGACVGFGESRAMSLLNRRRYDGRWLYRNAQNRDEFPRTPPEEGTSVRAGLDVLREVGHVRVHGARSSAPDLAEGIAANRWATSIDDWLVALGRYWRSNEVPFLNSWGLSYPHVVWVPVTVMDRLLREDGEFAIITDR